MLTINRITYLDQFYTTGIFNINDPEIEFLLYYDYIDVTQFLSKLENDYIYVATFEFVPSYIDGDDDSPKIISDFLIDKVHLTCKSFYLDESLLAKDDDRASVVIRYQKISLF